MAVTFAIAAFIIFTILLIRINQIGDRCWEQNIRLKEVEAKAEVNRQRIFKLEANK
jgi:hypothetical protein